MAQAVRRAIASGEHLAVQAGTGTGKSLAYLVPAIRHAVERGGTVVVSTATIALQRQLVDRDLPRLADGADAAARARADVRDPQGPAQLPVPAQAAAAPDDVDDADQLFDPFAGRPRWAARSSASTSGASDTETGDRDELVPGRARLGLAAGVGQRAGVPGRVALPGRRRLLRREGARAGRARGRRRHQPRAAGDRRAGGPPGAARARRRDRRRGARAGRPDHRRRDGGADVVRRSAAAARRCGKLVDQAVADRLVEAGEGLALVLEDAAPGRWDALPQAAAGVLSAVRDAAASCKQSLGGERREDPEGAAGRKVAQAALDEVADTAFRLLDAFDEPDAAKRRDVVWLAEQGPDGARSRVLRAAPLAVGGLLRERLFGAAP